VAREEEDVQVKPGDSIPGRFAGDESQLEWCSQSSDRSWWKSLVAQYSSRRGSI